MHPLLLLGCVLTAAPAASTPLRVPAGKAPVLVDGRLDPKEWSDAATFELPGAARVAVKEANGVVSLALELTAAENGSVDLYLSPADGSIYDLHASAKLGERKLQGPAWPDEWQWWNNEGWVANVSRPVDFEKRTFLPAKVREFQFRRDHFPGSRWKLMFEVMTEAKPRWVTSSFPRGAKNTTTDGWYELELQPK